MYSKAQWVADKVFEYKRNKQETLEMLLLNTTNVISKHIERPNEGSKAALEVCLECNKLFLKEIGILNE